LRTFVNLNELSSSNSRGTAMQADLSKINNLFYHMLNFMLRIQESTNPNGNLTQ